MYRKVPLARIKSSIDPYQGLAPLEVEAQRMLYGSNDILEYQENRYLAIAKDTIKDPMIWFLLGTSFLFALLKNYTQTVILLLATLPLIFMDAFLHWRTEASTQSLKESLVSFVKVLREAKELIITARDIVPGDLVIVSANQYFPADGILVEGKGLQVDESSLTGESFPAKKQILKQLDAVDSEIDLDDKYGEIVRSVAKSTESTTPLQKAIAHLVLTLIIVASIFCAILAMVRFYQGFGLIDAILSAAILAVAALPDEFPVVFTFFLGLGVYRLANKKALVQRGVSVENIGRVTTICSDKTGTITEGRFKLNELLPADAINAQRLLWLASLASRVESGDPLDQAILEEAKSSHLELPTGLKTFPFTETRKRETCIISLADGEYLTATKGSPETILTICSLNDSEMKFWRQKINELAAEGYKVIACAELLNNAVNLEKEPENGYQFSGLLTFVDPPRKEVFAAVKECLASGIHILMITGDHPETARSIAKSIGLGQGNPKVVLADTAEPYWENNDGQYFLGVDVIARAIPSQKLSVVTALQSINEIVAATGDGVNDVPALKAADIGIAMGERGTQSAREVSDIILLDDNFSSIVNAISEGRQLFTNLKLSFQYLLLIHIPFVISAAMVPLLGFPLLYYPIHIVFIELIIHPTCMLVFQDLPPSKKLSPVSHHAKIQLFSKRNLLGMAIIGVLSTFIVVASNLYINHYYHQEEYARSFAIAVLGFMSAGFTFALSDFKTLISRIVILGTLFFTVLLIELPGLSHYTQMTQLHIKDWLFISFLSLGIAGITRLLKVTVND